MLSLWGGPTTLEKEERKSFFLEKWQCLVVGTPPLVIECFPLWSATLIPTPLDDLYVYQGHATARIKEGRASRRQHFPLLTPPLSNPPPRPMWNHSVEAGLVSSLCSCWPRAFRQTVWWKWAHLFSGSLVDCSNKH